MSFREIRNFCEVMRSLGYPRLISLENFRTPNFALVADVLFWLVQRYDSSTPLSDCIDSEDDRVEFITATCQIIANKAQLKLNPRRLYHADGRAVQELSKLANILYKAQRLCKEEIEEDNSSSYALSTKLNDLKATRAMATEITLQGSQLYQLLKQEPELRQSRQRALKFLDSMSRNLDSSAERQQIEQAIRESIHGVEESVRSLEKQCSSLESEEKALQTKIKKKSSDLERKEKRLKMLTTSRPTFMDEFERQERELQRFYEIYLEKFRNLDYLEHELDLYRQAEREKVEEADRALKRMQKKLREEERRILRGEQDIDENALDELGREELLSRSSRSKRRVGNGRTGSISGSEGSGSDLDNLSESEESQISLGESRSERSGSEGYNDEDLAEDDLIEDDDDEEDDDDDF